MLTNREFHLQTGNLAYKTGFSFTKRESWVTKGILGLLFTDEKKLLKKIQEIFFNAKNPEILRKYTQLEGGSGLYKIYKTLQYNIMAPYSILYNIENSQFELIILIEINDLIIL